MKRIFLIAIACVFISSLAFAWGGQDQRSQQATPWKTYAVTNGNGTYLLTAVSTDIIPKGASILGYQIMGKPGVGSENVCTIYDGGVTSMDEVLGEAECLTNTKGGEWYNYPRSLEKGIYIHQGPKTVITIFYE